MFLRCLFQPSLKVCELLRLSERRENCGNLLWAGSDFPAWFWAKAFHPPGSFDLQALRTSPQMFLAASAWTTVNKPLIRAMLQLYRSVPEIPTFVAQFNSTTSIEQTLDDFQLWDLFAYLNSSYHDSKSCGSVSSQHQMYVAESLLIVIAESFVWDQPSC